MHIYMCVCVHTHTYTPALWSLISLPLLSCNPSLQGRQGTQRHGPCQGSCSVCYGSPICPRCSWPWAVREEGGSWTLSSSTIPAEFGKAISCRPSEQQAQGKHLSSIHPFSLPNIASISGTGMSQLLQSRDISSTHQHWFDWPQLKTGTGN